MNRGRNIVVVLMTLMLTLTSASMTFAQQATAAAAQGGDYVPVTSVPAQAEQLPAAPMLIGAYAFVWVVLLAYVFSLWRKMKALERELADLKRRVQAK